MREVKMKNPVLAPSLLSANLSNLGAAIKEIEAGGGSAVHIDVMDGKFVPEITYGQPVVRSIRPLTELPFDVHLMVENPDSQIDSFAKAGADWLTFHFEAAVHSHRIIQHIHSLGLKAGVSIVPSTPVSAISEIMETADIILVMTVNPGWGGQSLIQSCVRKISELDRIRRENGFGFMISADGGINGETVRTVADAGADILVSGSAFFSGSLNWKYGKPDAPLPAESGKN